MVTALGTIYLAASIISALVGPIVASQRDRPVLGRADQVRELTECNQLVYGLFDQLNHRVFSLGALAGSYELDLEQLWRDWSRRWQVRHREVGERCRFAELRGSGLGVAYDRMAYVHDDLGDLQRAYGVLLDRFIRKQASTVDRMRRDLELSKSLLDKRLRALVPP